MLRTGPGNTADLAFALWVGELAANPGDHVPVARREVAFRGADAEVELFAGGHRIRLMRAHHSIFEAFGLQGVTYRGLESRLVCSVVGGHAKVREGHGAGAGIPPPSSADFEYVHRFRSLPAQYLCSVQVERLPIHIYNDTVEDLVDIATESSSLVHKWVDAGITPAPGSSRSAPGICVSIVETTEVEGEVSVVSYHAQHGPRLIARTQSVFRFL